MDIRSVCRWLLVATLVAVGGCASAYHDYAQGCVSFCHCPRPPLPYRIYCAPNVPLTDCDRTKDWACDQSSSKPPGPEIPTQ